jgi:hypothetical protein
MTKRLIYLAGPPGSGKSSLMAKLTEPFGRLKIINEPLAYDALVDPEQDAVIGVELGIRRELFGGTDALPSSIIEKAVPWIKTTDIKLILAEGARLANKRFLLAAIEGGYTPTLVLLDHPCAEVWREERAAQIGRHQNTSWVTGRVTASRNLAAWAESEAIEVLRGHPDDLAPQLAALISSDG